MLASQRQAWILAEIRRTGAARVSELTSLTGVSDMTIRRDLEQLEADRAVMLAGISHDLRTPLARLRLETEMSPADISTKDAMVDDIEQMDRIIGRFLDYARPAQRTAEVVDLSALVREIAGRMASEDGVDLTLELADRALIEGDSTDMRRVIANLLENARKYGKHTEEEIPQIRVATYAQHGQVDIFVSDRGPGIPEDQIALVTRPFYRVDAARTQADGTGLGMAIVLRLVSRHRGALRLRNRQPGPGLEVSLNFPEYRGPGRNGDLVRDVARDGARDAARESKRDSKESKESKREA